MSSESIGTRSTCKFLSFACAFASPKLLVQRHSAPTKRRTDLIEIFIAVLCVFVDDLLVGPVSLRFVLASLLDWSPARGWVMCNNAVAVAVCARRLVSKQAGWAAVVVCVCVVALVLIFFVADAVYRM